VAPTSTGKTFQPGSWTPEDGKRQSQWMTKSMNDKVNEWQSQWMPCPEVIAL
jgi:hypothetical protein